MRKIGVIGGSGLYEIEGIIIKDHCNVDTPFGAPSDAFTIGTLAEKEIIFLPRHGAHHNISPTEINYRANIYAMKKLGVDTIISLSACGSLKEELKPLDFVVPLQFIDRTNQARKYTFFENGIVAHVSFAHPVCERLAEVVRKAAQDCKAGVHFGGTYLNMEGPQFSTSAESHLYRQWGVDIIGMTNIAEARLAREAEICFVTLAAITDYDCWHPGHDSVTLEVILENLRKNVTQAKAVLKAFIEKIPEKKTCSCSEALQYAIVTQPQYISADVKKRLGVIIEKYIS